MICAPRMATNTGAMRSPRTLWRVRAQRHERIVINRMVTKVRKMTITGWGVFWIFATIFYCIDTYVYFKGHDTPFWEHKTVAEKQHQKKQLGL